MMRRIIRLVSIIAVTAMLALGCTAQQPALPQNTTPIPEPTAIHTTGDSFPSQTPAPVAADTPDANIDVDYSEYIDTLLSKHVEWAAINDDVAGALSFMRMGEAEPYACYTPIVQSDDVAYYTTHNYDDRTVIGGAVQVLVGGFEQGAPYAALLIFGYRLGVNSYLDSEFTASHNAIFLLMDGEITQFNVFATQELTLEHPMDYTNGTIPAEAHDLISMLESYTNEEKLAYYKQIANTAQCPDAASKVLILCSDGKALNPQTMSVLYAYVAPAQ